MLTVHSIRHQICQNSPNKAQLAEMLIRQLRVYIRNYMTVSKKKMFMDHLQNFVTSLNNRELDRLGHMSPIEVCMCVCVCVLCMYSP